MFGGLERRAVGDDVTQNIGVRMLGPDLKVSGLFVTEVQGVGPIRDTIIILNKNHNNKSEYYKKKIKSAVRSLRVRLHQASASMLR